MIDIKKITKHFVEPNFYPSNSFLRLFCDTSANYDETSIVYCQINCHYFDLETNISIILKSHENLLLSSPVFLDYYRFKEAWRAKLALYLNTAIEGIDSSEYQTYNHGLLKQILYFQLENVEKVEKIYTLELNREKFLSSILDSIQKPFNDLAKIILWIDRDENINFLWMNENR